MARASIRWAGLLLSFIAALIVLTTLFSPATLSYAQDAAQELRSSFADNAAPGGMTGKIGTYVPKVYDQVQSWWHRLFPDSAELRGLQPEEALMEENDLKCRVYTYYNKSEKSEDTEALLQVWMKAWWALGLYPVILTNEMSVKHPDYETLHKRYADTGVNMERIDAVLAMAQGDYEGTLTANYVFPMAPVDDPLLIQMRQCQVLDVLSKYRNYRDDIVRGSSMAYKILVKALVDYNSIIDRKRVEILGIEGVPGANFREVVDTKTFAVYDSKSIETLYPTLYQGKPVGQGGRSFSFVKNQLAALVNAHLQNNFLVNHRGGIEYLEPDLDFPNAQYLSRPSLRLAKELTRCNLTPLPKTCAPQHASKATKCFDCAQLVSSAIIKKVPGFVPKNYTFFIGNVPHPLTTLAVAQDQVDFSARAVRDSARDVWSRKAITAALPPKSGAIQGLIFLADSLWANEDRSIPDAHLWHLFEDDEYADVEYNVGFTVPELKASLDQLPENSQEKSSQFQAKVANAKSLVMNPENATARDEVSLVEAWSQYDAGSHEFIGSYLSYKRTRLEKCKAENRAAFSLLELE